MLRFVLALALLAALESACASPIFPRKRPIFHTLVDAKNVTESSSSISLRVLDKPHHLFIGRCNPGDEVLHGENIILNNDGKSQVGGTIRINVDGPVYITCVKVLDQIPDGEGGYPSYVAGGVGRNYVSFNVTTDYGKGFNFYVQVNGYALDKESDEGKFE